MELIKHKKYNKRYLIAFASIFAFFIFCVITSYFLITSKKERVHIVNIAGKQRMLSQKTPKEILGAGTSLNDFKSKTISIEKKREVKALVDELVANHFYLRSKEFPPEIEKRIIGLQEVLTSIHDSTLCVLQSCKDQENELQNLMGKSNIFLKRMNETVYAIDEHYTSQNFKEFVIISSLFFAIFAFMSYHIFVVFAPMKSELLEYTDAVSEKEEFMRKMERVAKIGVWELDTTTGDIKWSDQVYEIHKLPIGTKNSKIDGISYYAEHERDRLTKMIDDCIKLKRRFDSEFQFVDNEGQEKWVRSIGEPILDNTGSVHKLVGTFQDITEVKLSELSLAEKTKDFANFFSLSVEMFCISGLDGYFKTINPAFSKILGYSDKDLLSKPLFEFVHPDDLESTENELVKLGNGIQTIAFRNRWKTNKGEYRVFSWNANADIETGNVYATARDITDILETQDQLEEQKKITQHNAKLASIGELAAGVGHEINNPLAIAKGYVQTLLNDIHHNRLKEDVLRTKLSKIDKSTDRIARIVKGLRTFARSDNEDIQKYDPVELVKESLSMIGDIYKNDGITINLKSNVSESEVLLRGHRGKIQQVLMNLLVNAKDATEGKPNRAIDIHLRKNDEKFMVSVTDNGSGVPDKIREKIFDPFYTTKEVNKGTGIGLSLAHRIVSEHDGSLDFETTLGQGSTFTFELPLHSIAHSFSAA